MLDTDTKRRIDTARDILVGKVPDPKSQVEQITIALIYKFMDDMDAESEELGGKRKFFTGDFARYGWAKLMRSGLGGHETLNLYAEGITKMPENPGIPPLFRDIFKNAYLPYRDPETLKAFLKIIDEFSYDHSERLGDAFEYLLSVLGSQGDAGQFRTPRHIIDFMVEVVAPQKGETILDPACGTAGFLISSYKHILKANTDANGHSTLTPDDKGRLAQNLKGYDISPDMVRLSLVNMYLHGFTDPHVYEYDTLTSEERWNEFADVILANPPFMSPKGGIKPHKRFSIQAKRSEVLFVDYMAEHLTSTGRAGIIVPEGIIFQCQTAYKDLRKMLVEDYLWAVVSLPAGVFNPYSGVKTSILFLDRNLARQTDDVVFVKVENDGFDLGAQRRPNGKNDLPEALKILNDHIKAQKSQERKMALTVSRKHLLESGGINLSGDRYRETAAVQSKWPMVRLGEVCEVISGQSPDGTTYNDRGEGIPFHQGKTEFTDCVLGPARSWTTAPARIAEPHDIVMSVRAPVGPVNLVTERICIGRGLAAIRSINSKIDAIFLFFILRGMEDSITGSHGAAFASINRKEIEAIEIPLPPLEAQERIVAELDGYRKIVEGARQILANYKPTIRIDPEWPMKNLGNIARNLDGKRVPIEKGQRKSGPYSYYGASGIVDYVDGYIFEGDYLLLSEDGANLLARSTPIAFSVSGKVWVNNHAHVLEFTDRATQRFVESYINSIDIKDFVTGAAQPKLSQANMNRIPIPFPEIDIQCEIVTEIEAEWLLVEANQKLVELFEKKIQSKLAEIWGKE